MTDDHVTGQQLQQELHELERRLESRIYTSVSEAKGHILGRMDCLESKFDKLALDVSRLGSEVGEIKSEVSELTDMIKQSLNGNSHLKV